MASLFVIRGKDAGNHYAIEKPRTVIGRDPSCDIHIFDHEVSRQHAWISKEAQQLTLIDNDSSNGTFVNGHRITSHLLRSGDRLQIGRSLLVFTDREASLPPGLAIEFIPPESPTASIAEELSQIRQSIPGLDLGFSSQLPASSSPSMADASQSLRVAEALPPFDTGLDRRHWEILYRTVLAVSRTIDIDQLLQQILDFIFLGVACDHGCIMLLEEDSQRLRPVAYRRRRPTTNTARLAISQTILDYVMKNREGVLTSNARDDLRWEAGMSIVGMGIREAICVPMLGRYGLVGSIYVDVSQSASHSLQPQPGGVLTGDDLKLMVAIGHQAALAVEDTFYYRGMVQAERLAAIGQTIATLSHHVKNILQGLSGGSYLVQEGIRRGQIDTISKGWKIVEKNQERIASLVMDMLTFSKERTPSRAPVDLREVIEDCLELLHGRLEERGILLDWHPPLAFPPVMADADAIHQAILNVLANAVDALSEVDHGRIQVVLRRDAEQGIIEIADNGPGIPTDELERIFSLFESTKGSRGTGLGLPVSQKILGEHGGQITVQSQVGQGSCFSLILPLAQPPLPTDDDMNRPTALP
jgi:signal transduction histidine kinase